MELEKVDLKVTLFEGQEGLEVYRTKDGLVVFITIDDTPKWGKLKHISMSRNDRLPSWDEVVEIKERFFGDIDVGMILPKKEDYVNLHKFCLHLWQLPEKWELR